MRSGEVKTAHEWLASEKFSKRIAAGEGGSWYGSGCTQPSHSSERSESQEFQGNSMRNRNPFSIAVTIDVLENFSSLKLLNKYSALLVNIFIPTQMLLFLTIH